MVLDPIPDRSPDPDCPKCGGEGVPQTWQHRFLGDEASNKACRHCYEIEDATHD